MRMNMNVLILGLLATALGGTLSPFNKAEAGEVCNYLNQATALAQAFRNADQVWVAEGWWLLDPGDCITYPDDALIHVRHSNDIRPYSAENLEITEAVTEQLCVVGDRFTAYRADNNGACEQAGGSLEPFVGFEGLIQ